MNEIIYFIDTYWWVLLIIAWFFYYNKIKNEEWQPLYKLWDIVLTHNKEDIYTQEIIIWAYRPWDQSYWVYILSSGWAWIDIYAKTEQDIIRKIGTTNMPVSIDSKKVLDFIKNEDYNHLIKDEIYNK